MGAVKSAVTMTGRMFTALVMSMRTMPFTGSIDQVEEYCHKCKVQKRRTGKPVIGKRPSVQLHCGPTPTFLLSQMAENPVIQVTEELLVVVLAVHVMRHVPLCPTKNPRVQVVR